MKLPEPVAWRIRCTDPLRDWVLMYHPPKVEEQFSNMEIEACYSETQLRAAIERRDAVLQMARDALENHMHGREATFGTVAAIKAIQEILT